MDRSATADGTIGTAGARGSGGACSHGRFRSRVRGLFGLGVRALGGSERSNADLAGVDLRTMRNDGSAPTVASIGRVGALLGLDVASACAIVAGHDGPATTLAADDHLAARFERAERCDDLQVLATLAERVAARATRPCQLGLARLAMARVAAARGETARVLPLLALARATGVPRDAGRAARRLSRQARADLALGAPWRPVAMPSSSTWPRDRRGAVLVGARFVPVALFVASTNARPDDETSTLHALLSVARGMVARPDSSRAHDALWATATGGLLALRIVEWATVRGDRAVDEAAASVVARAELALEDAAEDAVHDAHRGRGRRTLAVSRLARLQLAGWALRLRLGETAPEDCLPSDRTEVAGLLHRFPAAATDPGLARVACLQGRGSFHFQRIAH
jgi:hypothetical protein